MDAAAGEDQGNRQVTDLARSERWKRRAIWTFFCMLVVVWCLEASPPAWQWLDPARRTIRIVLFRVGLWQGEWRMFTPNPVLNNGWTYAEIYDDQGKITHWTSPDWATIPNWRKFYLFRHLNYYCRLDGNESACEGLARYLASTTPVNGRVTKVVLFQYRRKMLVDPESPYPKLSETVWGGGNQFLYQKSFDQ